MLIAAHLRSFIVFYLTRPYVEELMEETCWMLLGIN